MYFLFGFIPLIRPFIPFWAAVANLAGDLLGSGISAYANHREADLNREWQERMAKNAMQYRVADLKAAGLNPVLAGNMNVSAPAGSQAAGLNANFSNSAKSIMQLQQQEAENTVKIGEETAEKLKLEQDKLKAETEKVEKEAAQTPTLDQNEVNAIERKRNSSDYGKMVGDALQLGERFLSWIGVLPESEAQKEAEQRIQRDNPDMPNHEVKRQATIAVKEAQKKSEVRANERARERHESGKRVYHEQPALPLLR